jgi:hypothetical protein
MTKQHLQDSVWQYGRPDGDEGDRDHKRPRTWGLMHRVSNWIDGQGRSKGQLEEGDHGSGWYKGKSSHSSKMAHRGMANPTPRGNSSAEERRAIRGLCQLTTTSVQEPISDSMSKWNTTCYSEPQFEQGQDRFFSSDAIVVIAKRPRHANKQTGQCRKH